MSISLFDLQDGLELETQHRADFLRRKLKRAVADQQQHAPIAASVPGTQRRTLAGADGPTNAAPEDLVQCSRGIGHLGVPDTKVGSARLRHHHVVRLQEPAEARPEPALRDDLGVVASVGRCDRRRQLRWRLEGRRVERFRQFAQDALHADVGVRSVANLTVFAVEVDGAQLRRAVGEAGRVEVALRVLLVNHHMKPLTNKKYL